MPAIRNGTSSTETSPTKGGSAHAWSKADKAQLFHHVIKHGEKDWGTAVPGKTSQQAFDQWRKTLLPYIKKTCGF